MLRNSGLSAIGQAIGQPVPRPPSNSLLHFSIDLKLLLWIISWATLRGQMAQKCLQRLRSRIISKSKTCTNFNCRQFTFECKPKNWSHKILLYPFPPLIVKLFFDFDFSQLFLCIFLLICLFFEFFRIKFCIFFDCFILIFIQLSPLCFLLISLLF